MREYFGTEPPDYGTWTSDGPMRWVQDEKTEGRIAVIGGGVAGLFTAYFLNEKLPDARVTIFEASGRLGGKVRTESFSDGTPYEAGIDKLCQWEEDCPLRKFIENELQLETEECEGNDDPCYTIKNGMSELVRALETKIAADIRRRTRVLDVDKSRDLYFVKWRRSGREEVEESSDSFDAVFVAIPPLEHRMLNWPLDIDVSGDWADMNHEFEVVANLLFDSGRTETIVVSGEAAITLCCCKDDEIAERLWLQRGEIGKDDDHALVESHIHRWVGNPIEKPRKKPDTDHVPDPEDHPLLILCGSHLYGSSVNGAMIAAEKAVDLLLESIGKKEVVL